MFKIVKQGARGDSRLEADAKLTPADFADIARKLDKAPIRARKTGYVAARKATTSEMVETRWNGEKKSNTARPGDFIVANLSPQQQPLRDREGHLNIYVIAAEKFAGLYEPTTEKGDLGDIYRAKGLVSALVFPGGFDIVAPWGERQTGAAGYLLLNGDEVYGNHADTFAATYEVMGA